MKKKPVYFNLETYDYTPYARELTEEEMYLVNGGRRMIGDRTNESEHVSSRPASSNESGSSSGTSAISNSSPAPAATQPATTSSSQQNNTESQPQTSSAPTCTAAQIAAAKGAAANAYFAEQDKKREENKKEQKNTGAGSTAGNRESTSSSTSDSSSQYISYSEDKSVQSDNQVSKISSNNSDYVYDNNSETKKFTTNSQYEMAERDKKRYYESQQKEWNSYYQEKYQEYVVSKISEYEVNGKKFTCEDLPLSVLIDFAYENELPLKIKNKSRTYDIKKYKDIEKYKNKVLSTTAANDLMNNTVPVVPSVLTKGDIVLMDTGTAGGIKDGIMSHTQVVVNNDNGELIIKQGNLSEDAKRKHGAGDYGGQYYGGQVIQQRSLDIINDIFHGSDKDFPDATNQYGIYYRRWDYNAW